MSDAPVVVKTRRKAFSFDPPQPGIGFLELRNGLCKWPLGGPTDPPERFCGVPARLARPTAKAAVRSPIAAQGRGDAHISICPAGDRRRLTA